MVADGSEGTLNVFGDGWPVGDRVLISHVGSASLVTAVLRSGPSFLDLVHVEMLCGLVADSDSSGLWKLGRDGDVVVVNGGWIFDAGYGGGSFDASATARVLLFGFSFQLWFKTCLLGFNCFVLFFLLLSVLMDDRVSTSLFI